jgi:hypothetical protein
VQEEFVEARDRLVIAYVITAEKLSPAERLSLSCTRFRVAVRQALTNRRDTP